MSDDPETMDTTTITIRLIRSFEHRNIRNLVLHNISLDQTVDALTQTIWERLKTEPSLPPPFRTFPFDTLKIETHAYGFKTNDPVINRMDDERLIIKGGRSLRECGVRHETEISFFKMGDYQKYKENPVMVW
ncbi:UPF0538 protein C2orf76 homolog [Eriocheir sinensis]|uniref:UPF0538 protein C2orf76 homolog n=1 Tax=Eriocheir sinensis TaxID=95602 RepID=UPI0021C813E0|nr:UPF0538 protein C2orf76 homolog [Eriocheir sinensis]